MRGRQPIKARSGSVRMGYSQKFNPSHEIQSLKNQLLEEIKLDVIKTADIVANEPEDLHLVADFYKKYKLNPHAWPSTDYQISTHSYLVERKLTLMRGYHFAGQEDKAREYLQIAIDGQKNHLQRLADYIKADQQALDGPLPITEEQKYLGTVSLGKEDLEKRIQGIQEKQVLVEGYLQVLNQGMTEDLLDAKYTAAYHTRQRQFEYELLLKLNKLFEKSLKTVNGKELKELLKSSLRQFEKDGRIRNLDQRLERLDDIPEEKFEIMAGIASNNMPLLKELFKDYSKSNSVSFSSDEFEIDNEKLLPFIDSLDKTKLKSQIAIARQTEKEHLVNLPEAKSAQEIMAQARLIFEEATPVKLEDIKPDFLQPDYVFASSQLTVKDNLQINVKAASKEALIDLVKSAKANHTLAGVQVAAMPAKVSDPWNDPHHGKLYLQVSVGANVSKMGNRKALINTYLPLADYHEYKIEPLKAANEAAANLPPELQPTNLKKDDSLPRIARAVENEIIIDQPLVNTYKFKTSVNDWNELLGESYCEHPHGRWETLSDNGIETTAALSCADCQRARIKVIPLHLLPKTNPLSKIASPKKYLSQENIYRLLNNEPPAKTLGELRKGAKDISLEPSDYASGKKLQKKTARLNTRQVLGRKR